MPTVKLGPDARPEYHDANGNPAVGYKLFTYAAGSTTKLATYTDSTGTTANANPMILDAYGRTPFGKWYQVGLNYKEVLAPPTDTDPPTSPIFTADGLSGINDTTVTASGSAQWIASGMTPTYISATQFTIPGDQRSAFHVGRRLRITVTAGTLYGLITVSTYTTVTSITVALDSGVIDAGLSAVDLSILTSTESALPVTAFVRGLLDDADAPTFRASIGPDFVGRLLSVGVSAPPLVHTGGRESFTVKFGDATSQSIYDGVYPGATYFEAINGVAQINAGSTIEGITGIAGYVQNNVATKNAVGLFGCGVATVNSAAVWGINTLVQDSAVRAAGTGTGRTLINEFDFNVMNPGTSVIGCSVGGNSLAQPMAAKGYIANVLGTGFRWEIGFWAMDNACQTAFYAGLVGAGAPSENSQPIKFKSLNAASVAVEHSLFGSADFFNISSSSATFGVKIAGGTLLLDTGKNIIIGGIGVLGDRKTGYTNPMTGTSNRATAYDTSTITLVQLAERVRAIQQDLTAHGIIGV